MQISMKGVYVFFADGFEETEALTTVDMLLRGGIDVKTVSIYDHNSVRSAHKIHIMTELDFNEFLDTVQLEGTTDEPGRLQDADGPYGQALSGRRKRRCNMRITERSAEPSPWHRGQVNDML